MDNTLNKKAQRKWGPALLGAAALVLCVVMSLHSMAHAGLPGCSAGSSCDGVLGTPWSLILGVLPVSVLAAGIYVSFLLCLFLEERVEEPLRPLVGKLELVFCGAIAGSAVWFTLLQLLVIGSFCKYCLAAHSIGLILAVWMLFRTKGLPRRFLTFALGVCLACALAFFQAVTVDDSGYYEGSSEADLPVPSEKEFPVLGNGAETVVLMYDYQCPHCRKVHDAVRDIVEKHPSEFRFILCPTPLSNECNPYIPAGKDHFPGSCDYARLALAVWALAPERFPEIDACLWDNPENAEDLATELLGRRNFDDYLASDKAFISLSRSFELFGRTNSSDKAGLPRFIIGQNWIIPESSEPETLLEILR